MSLFGLSSYYLQVKQLLQCLTLCRTHSFICSIQLICFHLRKKSESQMASVLLYCATFIFRSGFTSWNPCIFQIPISLPSEPSFFQKDRVAVHVITLQALDSPPDTFYNIPLYFSGGWGSCSFISMANSEQEQKQAVYLDKQIHKARSVSLNDMTHSSLNRSCGDAHPHKGFAHHLNIYLITHEPLNVKPVTHGQCCKSGDAWCFSQQHPHWFCWKMRFRLMLTKQGKSKSMNRRLLGWVYKLSEMRTNLFVGIRGSTATDFIPQIGKTIRVVFQILTVICHGSLCTQTSALPCHISHFHSSRWQLTRQHHCIIEEGCPGRRPPVGGTGEGTFGVGPWSTGHLSTLWDSITSATVR